MNPRARNMNPDAAGAAYAPSRHASSITWNDAVAATGPEPGVVELWWIDIGGASRPSEQRLLDGHELRRAAALRRDRDRHRYVRAHAALRTILGRYARIAPAALPIAIAPQGKPYLAQAGAPAFNLSHAEDVALLALAPSGAIGVDVEAARRIPDVDALARRFLCADEAAAVCAATPDQRDHRFQVCWTRKEAVLKASGQGLVGDTQAIAVGADAGTTRLTACGGERELELIVMSLVPAPGFVAALAVESAIGMQALRCYR